MPPHSHQQGNVAPTPKIVHDFDSFTYTRPTYCDLCDKFLWGIVKQGYQCRDCGFNVHKKCLHLVATPCAGYRESGQITGGYFDHSTRSKYSGAVTSDDEDNGFMHIPVEQMPPNRSRSSPSLSALNIDDNLLPEMPHHLHHAHTTKPGPSSSSSSSARPSTSTVRRNKTSNNNTTKAYPGSGSAFSDSEDSASVTTTQTTLIKDLMTNTAINSVSLNKERKEASPPLNLLTTTPRNFTRFVTRLGPVVDLFDAVTDIMTWKDPTKTLVALLGYVII
ncbi:Ras guanyl-releasing protein 3, partial [Blyttiomyces sp. JEL0837]